MQINRPITKSVLSAKLLDRNTRFCLFQKTDNLLLGITLFHCCFLLMKADFTQSLLVVNSGSRSKHQNVNVNDGGQAIVGDVNKGEG